MSSEYQLNVTERDSLGTNSIKKLRRQGLIPANFYQHGGTNINLAVDKKALQVALRSGSHLFAIQIGKKSHHVQIKELQYHPVTDDIIHVDFMGFKMTEKISIMVPLVFVGEAPGAKQGGILMHNINQVEIFCLPGDVPKNIVIDISNLGVDEHISVSDLVVPKEIEIHTSPDTPIIAAQSARGTVEEAAAEPGAEDTEEASEE